MFSQLHIYIFVRFGYFTKDRTVAMFNLEVVHGKKTLNFM